MCVSFQEPMAGIEVAAQRTGARRARGGALRSTDRGVGAAGASQRPRRALPVDPLHRSEPRAVGREHGEFVRQCADRVRHRTVQDGKDPRPGSGKGSRTSSSRLSGRSRGTARAACLEPVGTCPRTSSSGPTRTASGLQLAWRHPRNELSGETRRSHSCRWVAHDGRPPGVQLGRPVDHYRATR
jgi:hypothetical protein